MTEQINYTLLAILDVGHGNSAVLIDDGQTVVIDAGPRSGLLEYLTQNNIRSIDTILLSHADADHIGGLVAVLASKSFQIKKVRVNTDALKNSAIWDDLLYELERLRREEGIDFRPSLTSADNGNFDTAAVRVQILAPNTYLAGRGIGSTDRSGRSIQTNTLSSVIRLLVGDKPLAVFLGDIDDVGMDNLVEAKIDATAPILVFPHHGGRAGHGTEIRTFTEKICDIFQPKQVVFSIGRDRAHLRPEVIETILKREQRIRIVCTQLSPHCATELPKQPPNHLSSAFAAGKEYHKCCAGTLIVQMTARTQISPEEAEHLNFIKVAAPKALCQRSV